MKKGERKKPQRGSATRVTPRESNFKVQRNPRAVETAKGERQSLLTESLSGAPEARNLKGRQKVRRESRDGARVKPSNGQGAEQPGAKLRG